MPDASVQNLNAGICENNKGLLIFSTLNVQSVMIALLIGQFN